MYVSTPHPPVPWAFLLRAAARTCAVILFAGWAAFLAAEMVRPGFQTPLRTMAQAVALAVVFGGYAVGWKHELIGGLMTLAGVVLFYIVNVLDTQVLPAPEAAWFAVPGLLYLLAHVEGRPQPATEEATEPAL